MGFGAGVVGSGGAHGQKRPHLHIVVQVDLARETRFLQELAHVEDHHLSLGHVLGFAFQKLDAAGGALGVASAGVHDVDARVLAAATL